MMNLYGIYSPSPPLAKQVAGEGRGEGEIRQNYALGLRKNPTDAEKLIWQRIRSRQIAGCKFRRQYPVDDYIPDFVCFDPKIVVEIDGGQHNENVNDIKRDKHFSDAGFKVLRFWNHDVLSNINGVLATLEQTLNDRFFDLSTPSPQPSPATHQDVRGGEGEE